MDKTGISRIIHAAHENMAGYYGDLNIYGQVAAKSLEAWNYLRNVHEPIKRIVSNYCPFHPFTMLDAGCGNGQLFHLFASLGAEAIYGVDFSHSMLQEAQRRSRVNQFQFFPVRARLEELGSLKDDSFHLVNLYGVIEHLPEPVRVLNELKRVILPGGILIFSVPRKGSLAWLTYGLFCRSLEDYVSKESLWERTVHRRKMILYRFYRAREIEKMISLLTGMTFLIRLPVAYGGMLGPPGKPLKKLGKLGRYNSLDRWNKIAKMVNLIPAGEYLAFRKTEE